ncbi:hypothetical protein LZ32DRAFT_657022 [Colletotrichum eremochloae]|nr:hypothetical protein LZ32DRAFT_657022 [Colletotrichum eremochloae]
MAKKQEEVSVLVIQMCTEILEIASNRSQQYHSCNCANPGRSHVGSLTPKQRATYKILGRALRDEFYLIFYERQTQYFTCCWGLLSQLRAEIHWCGPESDKASKELTIKLSKGTTAILNAREEKFQIEFPFTIRGVKVVDIQHVRSAAKFQLNDFERQSLHSALELNVLMPRQYVYAGWRSF